MSPNVPVVDVAAEALIDDYVRGAFSERELDRIIEQHLKLCTSCQECLLRAEQRERDDLFAQIQIREQGNEVEDVDAHKRDDLTTRTVDTH